VVDCFLHNELARTLAAEARAHRASFRPHAWIFGGLKLPKPGVSELDMHDAEAEAILPAFHAFWRDEVPRLVARVREQLGFAPEPSPSADAISVKVQRNDGRGGCFPLHHDNPGPPSKRVLTIVIYLNEGWVPGDGGEIVLVPFVGRRTAVAPTFNRAVLFRSDLALHGVLPAAKERLCFTVWIDDAARANRPEQCNLTRAQLCAGAAHDGSAEGLAAFFRASPLQRSIVRAVYAEEMSRDLSRCLRAAGGIDERKIGAIVKAHEDAAAAQRQDPALRDVINALVQLKRAAQEGPAEDYDGDLLLAPQCVAIDDRKHVKSIH
jgi:hypothetical protein